MWIVFFITITILLILDLGIFSKHNDVISFKSSIKLSLFYITFACLFGIWIAFSMGHEAGEEYFNGFLIEKVLSIDNIFVISMIFKFFDIQQRFQHRVLFWGILSVIVMRGIMIYSGSILIAKFSWILYIFGAFLVLTGIKMLYHHDRVFKPQENVVIKYAKKHLNISEDPGSESKFWFSKGRRVYFTKLFLALVSIESVDLVFALDSIPAIFAITNNTYVIYTSNIFAILGLRALYFCLSGAVEKFKYLKYSLALILVFVGIKIFLVHFIGPIPSYITLGVTCLTLLSGIAISLYKKNEL
jgi:tellurite resistance protein TerC